MAIDAENFDRLRQRRDWLTARIAAKRSVGWDVTYDTSERDALTWALNELTYQAAVATNRANRTEQHDGRDHP